MASLMVSCPVCSKMYPAVVIESHVDICLSMDFSVQPTYVDTTKEQLKKKEEEENERLFREFLEKEKIAEANQLNQEKTEFFCILCKSNFIFEEMMFLDTCGHFFCQNCAHKAVIQLIEKHKCSSVSCWEPSCKASLSTADLKQLLNQEEYELYVQNSLTEVVSNNGNFIRCPNNKCNNIIEKLLNDKTYQVLSPTEHKEQYRFRCRICSTEFCAGCGLVPYHEGYTCEKFKEYKKAKHCRFCGEQLTTAKRAPLKPSERNFPSLSDVCTKEECLQKRSKVCTKQHPCTHNCTGIRGEKECLPCLHPDCRAKSSAQNGLDYCNICWVEDLQSAPALRLECGHIFHAACVEKQLAQKWPSCNITFGFCDCPLCGRWISHPSLAKIMDPIKELYETLKEKAMHRLKFLNLENAKEIVTEGDIFYKNPVGYALKRFCYYPCFKCKKPYFGGERACNAALRVDPNFNPAELICGSCSAGSDKQNCTKHGKDYIEWKCKFCCQVACWFCWGNTHFCDDCHKQASKISKTPKEQLPKCNCKVKHPPNGEEHCFGCSLCFIEPVDF